MNLENLNLVELNAQEVVSIEGGSFWGWLWNNVIVSGYRDITNTTSDTVKGIINYLSGNTYGIMNPNDRFGL
jgi:hypothetical protein